MRPRVKNYPFIHKPYTLCVLCVLRGEFLQCTQIVVHYPNPPSMYLLAPLRMMVNSLRTPAT